jgi:hypothetical protein
VFLLAPISSVYDGKMKSPGPIVWWCACCVTLSVLASPESAFAQARAGTQFQVNTLGGDPEAPSTAVDPNGGFVSVWTAALPYGTDTSYESIQGQRHDSGGNALGSQFQVNSSASGPQYSARVGKAADGSFVAIWIDETLAEEFDTQTVAGRRFDAAGSPVALQQLIRDPLLFAGYPAIAVGSGGDYVAFWNEYVSSDPVTPGAAPITLGLRGQRFDSSGNPLGSLIETDEFGLGGTPVSVAMDAAGNFVVIWSNAGLMGQRYTAGGSPSGGSFLIAADGTGPPGCPDCVIGPSGVAMGSDGSFVVAWESTVSAGTDSDGTSIQARRYDAAGDALAAAFQVNVVETGNQEAPSISLASNGDFVIAWASDSTAGNDTSGSSIQARRYLANGTAVGEQFQVNSLLGHAESLPSVAVEPGGDFLISWESEGWPLFESYIGGDSIEAQRYTPAAIESPEISCDDSFDNDVDGDTDCADSSCDGVAGCTLGSELTCDDSIDNDGDGGTDCGDSECHGVGSCTFGSELDCADGFDNDGDGREDCQDFDCNGIGGCQGLYELSCVDTLDNDSDGDVDCSDADCASSFLCNPPVPSDVPSLSPLAALGLAASLVVGALAAHGRRRWRSASAANAAPAP